MQGKSKAQLDAENGGSLEVVFSSPRYMPHSPTPSPQLSPSSPSSVPRLSLPQTASIPPVCLKLQRSVAAIIDGNSAIVADTMIGAGQAPGSSSGLEITARHILARRLQSLEAGHQAEAAQQVGHGRFPHSALQASSRDILGQVLARVANLEGEVLSPTLGT